nr:MAP7 domain-containing protein 1-like [Aegilops tauschii subsp. strangulata]
MPQSDKGWSCAKLTDERATSVLEQMNADLKPGNAKAAKLAAALRLLVGDDQEYLSSVFVPLFRRKDGAQVMAARPTFDGRGLVPPAPTRAPVAPTSVELSSDELSHGAKKRKEDASTPPGTRPSTADAPPSVEKGSDGTRTSPARSSSRGLEEHPRGESAPVAPLALEALVSSPAAGVPKVQEPPVPQAVVTIPSPPPPAAPLTPGPSASPDVLEHALLEMTRLREDLQGADPHLVAGRLELVSGWLHSDVSVRAALSQATATSEKERQVAAQAAAAREAALKDAETAQDRCRALEAELKNLRDLHAEETRGRQAEEEKMRARDEAIKDRNAELGELAKAQAMERSRLEELERKMEVEKADCRRSHAHGRTKQNKGGESR